MRISLGWIKEFIDIPRDVDRIVESLTLNGFEVEEVIRPYRDIDKNLKIVRIIEHTPHPTMRELSIVKVSDGVLEHIVICGAKNVRTGAFTIWAPPGSKVIGHEISSKRFGDIVSNGMLLSLMDLGLEERSDGIWLFDTEEPAGTLLAEILDPEEVVLDINVTPNRGDALSHIGIAREISVYFGRELNIPSVEIETLEDVSPIRIIIEDETACPIYQGTYAENIIIKESDIRIQKRLIGAGLRPINNIVDLSNYIMLETGHPTHTFDFNFIKGAKIVVRSARDGEEITLLNGITLSLNNKDLLICDEISPLALAGIMGGESSSITGSTDKILLECAVFHPDNIRLTIDVHNVNSDSSYRFARGVDTATVDYASKRFMHLLKKDIPNCCIYKSLTVKSKVVDEKKILILNYDKCDRLLNKHIENDFIKKTLLGLGFGIREEGRGDLEVIIPSFRYDISIEEDIIEEIARIYGYNRFGIRLPHTETFETDLNKEDRSLRRIKYLLSDLGINEVINYTFTSEDLNSVFSGEGSVKLKNPIAQEMASMRGSILPSLIGTLRLNLNRQNRNLRLFEIGTVFYLREDIVEENHLGILLSGNRFERIWSQPQEGYNFYDLKGILETLFEGLNLKHIKFTRTEIPPFLHPGISASIEFNGDRIGIAGELHPNILKQMDIKQRVLISELNLDLLLSTHLKSSFLFREYSPYPAVDRDIALVISKDVTAADIISEIHNMQIEVIEDISIFDIYEGNGIEHGKRSIGIAIKYRSRNSTLTDEDVEKVHSKIIDNLIKKFYASLR